MRLLIKGGRVINPATNTDELLDVLVEDGVVTKLEQGIDGQADRTIDASGCLVMPGFIDLHVHGWHCDQGICADGALWKIIRRMA